LGPSLIAGLADAIGATGVDIAALVAALGWGENMNLGEAPPFLFGVLTFVGTLAAVWVGHRLESRAHDAQHDREPRSRDTRRELLVELQHALVELRDGVGVGAVVLAVDTDPSAAAAPASGPETDARNEPRRRAWQNAARRVAGLAAQLDDEALTQAAKAVGVTYEAMQAIDNGDRQALQDARKRFEAAYARANDRVGHLLQNLDASPPDRAGKGT
jgi:hypothetical protein